MKKILAILKAFLILLTPTLPLCAIVNIVIFYVNNGNGAIFFPTSLLLPLICIPIILVVYIFSVAQECNFLGVYIYCASGSTKQVVTLNKVCENTYRVNVKKEHSSGGKALLDVDRKSVV